jgi:hypothetical protein
LVQSLNEMEQIRRWVSVMTRIRFQTKSGAKGSA